MISQMFSLPSTPVFVNFQVSEDQAFTIGLAKKFIRVFP